MRANKVQAIYVLELLENSTLDKDDCVTCIETKKDLIKILKMETK